MATYLYDLDNRQQRDQRNGTPVKNVRMSWEFLCLCRKTFHNMIAVQGTATIRLRIAMTFPTERGILVRVDREWTKGTKIRIDGKGNFCRAMTFRGCGSRGDDESIRKAK